MNQTTGASQTVLSKGAVFEGTITSQDSIRIDGKVTGEIRSEATIEVGSSGEINGNLTAKNVITAGRVKGGIKAEEKVELKGTSKLDGDLVTVRLVIEDGAQFEGMCSMGSKKAAAAATAAPQPAAAKPESDEPVKEETAASGLFGRKNG